MNFITNNLETLILLVISLVLGADRLRIGGASTRKQISDDYRERNAQLDAQITELKKLHLENAVELSAIKAMLLEKDKHIESLTKLIQGKNPEMEKLLERISESNKAMMQFMEKVNETLVVSHREMKYQTNMLENTAKRNSKIDEASLSHDGEPALIPNE